MAETKNYCSKDEYKLMFWDGDVDDHQDDEMLDLIIPAVSREIDRLTFTRFFTTDDNETRYFTPNHTEEINLPIDLLSINTMKTDEDGDRTYEITWQTTDYDLLPFNALVDLEPFRDIRISPAGSYAFPLVQKGLQISGKFGYCSSDNIDIWAAEIKMACLLGCHRIVKRLDTPLGISGVSGMVQPQLQVQIPKLQSDPDWWSLVAPYRVISR